MEVAYLGSKFEVEVVRQNRPCHNSIVKSENSLERPKHHSKIEDPSDALACDMGSSSMHAKLEIHCRLQCRIQAMEM